MVVDPIVTAGALVAAVRVDAAGIGLLGATVGMTIILGMVGWLPYRRRALRRMGPMQG